MGWIKLDRKIMDNDLLWGCDEPFSRGQAWIDLLLLANHKDGRLSIRGEMVDVKRGDVNRSLRFLAKRWGWSVGKVTRFIEKLECEGMVTKKQNTRWNTTTEAITIVNYAYYQDVPDSDGTQNGTPTEHTRNTCGTHTEHIRNTNKKEKKEKKVKKDKKYIYNNDGEENNARAREHDGAAVISFPLEDGTEYAVGESELEELRSRYPTINVLSELAILKGWCLDNPGKRKTRRGAKAFISNWMNRVKREREIAEAAANAVMASNAARQPRGTGAKFIDLLEEGEL